MIRLLIADDHNLFREGILLQLEKEEDLVVVGEAEDGLSLIAKFNEVKPDLIVSDISMPRKNGPDAIRNIIKKHENVRVLFLSQYTGDDYIYSVLEAGGHGLISKNVMRQELLHAIRTIAKGEKYFVGKSEEELDVIRKRYNFIRKRERRENVDILTTKEKEILLLLSKNLSSREIAETLKVSVRTVDSHRKNVISKLQLKSLPGLISFAKDFAKEIEN